jgi:hypothetical protein
MSENRIMRPVKDYLIKSVGDEKEDVEEVNLITLFVCMEISQGNLFIHLIYTNKNVNKEN